MTDIEKLYEKETGKQWEDLGYNIADILMPKSQLEWLEQKAESGQKAIAELKIAKLDSARLIVQEEMYESLKCCGNCSHTNDGFECAFELPMTQWNDCCPKWHS